MTTPAREPRAPITYPRDAIVETEHVSAALGVSPRKVAQMDLPCFYVGSRPRFVWGQVFDALAQRATPDARPRIEPRRRRSA